MARLTRIHGENWLRLKVATVEPDGSPVLKIGGKNGVGKTSLARIVDALFGGARHLPDQPLRRGAKKGKIEADIDHVPEDIVESGGLRFSRTLGKKGCGPLKITGAKGEVFSSPQKLADRFYSTLTLDPMKFDQLAREKPREAAELLRKLIGLDLSVIDADEKMAYDDRTIVGREQKRLQAFADQAPHHKDAPKEAVSVAELAEEAERRRNANRENQAHRDRLTSMRAEAMRLAEAVRSLKGHLAETETALVDTLGAGVKLAGHVAALVDQDVEEIAVKLSTIEDDNRKVRENASWQTARETAYAKSAKYDELTERIEKLIEQRDTLIEAAEYPIPDLRVTADGVELDGLPWAQAAMSQRIVASVGLGFAQNPELKILRIEQGSYLDQDNLALVAELAEKAGGLALVEVVGDDGDCAIVLEDGEVK